MRSASSHTYRGRVAVIRRAGSEKLSSEDVAALRELFRLAWSDECEEFTEEDWNHAVGGIHFIVDDDDGTLLAHVSVVERELHTSGHHLPTGYVEAVATAPSHRRRGYGSALMKEAGEYIDRTFQLGALGTGHIAFYERLGWSIWQGPTFVRSPAGLIRTPDEDGYVLVRLTPTSPKLDLAAPISCDWRAGDVW